MRNGALVLLLAASPALAWAQVHAGGTGGGGNHCPASPVTREQMGVFIAATFGLALYGP